MQLHTWVIQHRKKGCTESWLWEKHPLPHKRVKSASVCTWFLFCSDSLPTKLQPCPKWTYKSERWRHSTNQTATLPKMNLQSERWTDALLPELQPCLKWTYSLRGGQVLYQLNCNPAQNELTSLRGGQLQGGCNTAGWAVSRILKWTLKKPSQSCPHLSVMPQLPSGTDFRLHNLKHRHRSSVRVEISPTEQTVTLKTW